MSKTYRPELKAWQLEDEIGAVGGYVSYHEAVKIQKAVREARAAGASLHEARMLAHSLKSQFVGRTA
jgi:hypothetical protein